MYRDAADKHVTRILTNVNARCIIVAAHFLLEGGYSKPRLTHIGSFRSSRQLRHQLCNTYLPHGIAQSFSLSQIQQTTERVWSISHVLAHRVRILPTFRHGCLDRHNT
jgi:hypothetical protein